MELVIGDKAWSSWSLRPWLAMKRAGLPFTETLIPLRRPDTAERIRAAGSPSGRIPILKTDDDLVVWDSLAICEWAAERAPALWPADPAARAVARAASAEMHAGFAALRAGLPMDLHARELRALDAPTAADVDRVVALWRSLRDRWGAAGPFLLGDWSIADAMFTPVATRFRSYGVDLARHSDDGTAAAYVAELLRQPEFLEWEAGAVT